MSTQANVAENPSGEDFGRWHLWRVLVVAGAWLAGVLFLADRETFHSPLNLLIAFFSPFTALLVFYMLAPGFRAWVNQLDLAALVGMQAWRTIGALFLPLWAFGLLPVGFAAPAAIGDIAVGIAAPFVALAVARQTKGWRLSVVGLCVAGGIDFVVVLGSALLASPGGPLVSPEGVNSSIMGALPMSVIPTFLAPAFLVLHAMSLLNLGSKLRRSRTVLAAAAA